MTLRLRHVAHGQWAAANSRDLAQSREYPLGAVVAFDEHEEASDAHRNWWFAVLDKAWRNLPDDLRRRFPDKDALRAHVLIKAGWCNSVEFVADSDDKVATVAASLRWTEPYAIVQRVGDVGFAYWPKSQKGMSRTQFKDVTNRGVMVLAEMLGVDPVALLEAQEAA